MKKTTQKRGFGFNVRLMMIFILIIICLISLMTTTLYCFFLNRARETVQESMQTAIHVKTESIRAILRQLDTVTAFLCDDSELYHERATIPDIYLLLKNYQRGGQITQAVTEYSRLTEMTENYFNFLGMYNGNYSVLLHVDNVWSFTRHLRSVDGSSLALGKKGIFNSDDLSQEEWYQTAVESDGEPYWFSDPETPGRLHMAKQLYCKVWEDCAVKSYKIGVLYVSFDISWMAKEFEENETSYVAIRDQDGHILYANEAPPEEINLAQICSSGSSCELENQGKSWLATELKISQELRAVMVLPVNLNDSGLQNFNMVFLLGFATILIGCLLVAAFSQRITRPIKALAFYMEEGSLLPLNTEVKRTDEVGMLYRGYNSLVAQIHQLVQNITQSAERRKRAELRALQAQINPHFIYNTLDTICCLLMLEGQGKIADILVALSQIIRYNTKKPEELVPLSRELEILQKYYLIQQSCYEDALFLECTAEADTPQFLVPKQILQPLVENAILHGTNLESGRGLVRVQIRCCGEELWIDVWDNGKKADIAAINAMLCDPTAAESSENIGIKNIHERIRYIYGSDSGLTFLSDEEGCTVARIRIARGEKTDAGASDERMGPMEKRQER